MILPISLGSYPLDFMIYNVELGTVIEDLSLEEVATRTRIGKWMVSQYTGFKDLRGKKIYFGDIVAVPWNRIDEAVVYLKGGLPAMRNSTGYDSYLRSDVRVWKKGNYIRKGFYGKK